VTVVPHVWPVQALYRDASFIGQVLIAYSQLNLTPSFSRIPEQQPGRLVLKYLAFEVGLRSGRVKTALNSRPLACSRRIH